MSLLYGGDYGDYGSGDDGSGGGGGVGVGDSLQDGVLPLEDNSHTSASALSSPSSLPASSSSSSSLPSSSLDELRVFNEQVGKIE
jgi:hypothetical protein